MELAAGSGKEEKGIRVLQEETAESLLNIKFV
jgi:hypothetical protein